MLGYISVHCGSRSRHLRPQVWTLGAAYHHPLALRPCKGTAAVLQISQRSWISSSRLESGAPIWRATLGVPVCAASGALRVDGARGSARRQRLPRYAVPFAVCHYSN